MQKKVKDMRIVKSQDELAAAFAEGICHMRVIGDRRFVWIDPIEIHIVDDYSPIIIIPEFQQRFAYMHGDCDPRIYSRCASTAVIFAVDRSSPMIQAECDSRQVIEISNRANPIVTSYDRAEQCIEVRDEGDAILEAYDNSKQNIYVSNGKKISVNRYDDAVVRVFARNKDGSTTFLEEHKK